MNFHNLNSPQVIIIEIHREFLYVRFNKNKNNRVKKILLLLTVITLTLTSCQKDILFKEAVISLKYKETKQLTLDNLKPNKDVTYRSTDPFVATVNSSGLVTAITVGKAVIIAELKKVTTVCWVTVDTTSFLYNEPILDFGASLDSIKKKETRELEEKGEAYLYYYDSILIQDIEYFFSDNKLVTAAFSLQLNDKNAEEVHVFLSERYGESIPNPDSEGDILWQTDTFYIQIVTNISEQKINVYYKEGIYKVSSP